MIITIAAADVGQLAALALAEAESCELRTPERRAAAHLWVALTVPPAGSLDAARRAIASFGSDRTQSGALDLLGRLAAELAASPEGHS